MSLAAVILAYESAHCLPAAVHSVLGHVDRVCVAVDDRSDTPTFRATLAWLDTVMPRLGPLGLEWWTYTFTMETGSAGSYNSNIDRAGADWTFVLDADETVDPAQARNLRSLCERGDDEGVDLWGFPRHHWVDLTRLRHRSDWWPDYQWRLMRPNVRFRWKVHPQMVGYQDHRPVEADILAINHWNLVYRTPEDWAEVNRFYAELLELDRLDGRTGNVP